MNQIKLNPYIARDGDTRQMLEFYHQIFGGNLSLQTYGDTPMPTPASHKDKVMHGRLGSGFITIMAADSPPDMPLSSTHSNISLSVMGPKSEEPQLKKIFDALAKEGKVTMPMEKQFWGDVFGMVDDQFGVHWMVNVGEGEPDTK